jgi:hypothetical protein
VSSVRGQICSVTSAFPGSEANPAPLAEKAEATVRGIGPFPPDERGLFMALAAVAESARNAAQIQEDGGPAWATTLAGESVLARLMESEARLSAACR